MALAACALWIGTSSLQSCKDDNEFLVGEDGEQPSWLGSSIYEQLQSEGNYTTLLKLIDDVDDNKEVLSRTGSKTLFAADDDAFQTWFNDNNWKVKQYSDLSLRQKKVLLNNSLLDNAYLLDLMSNVKATSPGARPEKGMAMRRPSSASIYDSVAILKPEEMPTSSYWKEVREKGKPIYIFRDNTNAPLIHFLPAFMQRNGITAEDLSYLTNGRGKSISESWVNGAKIINSDQADRQGIDYDITCKNGYIHKVDRVIEASPNMAEIIHQHDNTSLWASIIDRFSAPYDKTASQTNDENETQLKKWQRLYNMSDNDTVYTWRYLNSQSDGTVAANPRNALPPNSTKAAEALLRFDPGWNTYIYTNTAGQDMYYDAGAMLVPTNQAIQDWWNGDGIDLQQEYKELDSVPMETMAKLVNVNMMSNFIETVPTKFSNILNDAKEELGVKKENIVTSYMGCNGVVYVVDKLFTPAEFASVAYPATAHPSTMSIIYWAISELDYLPYLLSMDQTYTLLLPTNNAMLYYPDPSYFNTKTPAVISFTWDPTKKTGDKDERVQGNRFNMSYDEEGNIVIGTSLKKDLDQTIVKNRLKDLVNQLIVIGDITDGREYYKTKGGSLVHVTKEDGKYKIQGGFQMANNGGFVVDPAKKEEFVEKRNGKSVIIDAGVPMTTGESVYQILSKKENTPYFGTFYDLMWGTTKLSKSQSLFTNTDGARRPAGGTTNYNISLFSNYNYTVYVPTNEALQQLIDDGYLPTWTDWANQTQANWKKRGFDNTTASTLAKTAQNMLAEIILGFVRYHIQDNSLAVGSVNSTVNGEYESMYRNTETDRFYGMTTELTPTDLNITDGMGNTVKVDKSNGMYNIPCREYWLSAASPITSTIYFVSSAVVHQIDGVLMPKPLKKWNELLDQLEQDNK